MPGAGQGTMDAPRRRTFFSWGAGSSLHILETSPQHQEPVATIYQWPGQDPLQRKLGNDALVLYEQGAAQAPGGGPSGLSDPQQAAQAMEYAAGIEACMDVGHLPATDAELDVLRLRAAWSLVSIFFVGSWRHQGRVVEPVVEWLRKHFAAVCSPQSASLELEVEFPLIIEAVQSGAIPEERPEYWKSVRTAVALGWQAMADELLASHSAFLKSRHGDEGATSDAQALDAVRTAILRMPRLSVGPEGSASGRATSAEELQGQLTGWTTVLQDLHGARDLWEQCSGDVVVHLRAIIGMLLGSQDIEGAVSDPLEVLAATLLHRNPLAMSHEIAGWLRRCGGDDGDECAWARHLLDACASGEREQVLRLCSERPGSEWLMVHVFPLLRGSGASKALSREIAGPSRCTQEELFVLRLVRAQAAAGQWAAAARYLLRCPVHGRDATLAVMRLVPARAVQRSAVLARTLAAHCRAHGLPEAAQVLGRTLAVAGVLRGAAGDAVEAMVDSQDAELFLCVVLRPLLSRAAGGAQDRALLASIREIDWALRSALAWRGVAEGGEFGPAAAEAAAALRGFRELVESAEQLGAGAGAAQKEAAARALVAALQAGSGRGVGLTGAVAGVLPRLKGVFGAEGGAGALGMRQLREVMRAVEEEAVREGGAAVDVGTRMALAEGLVRSHMKAEREAHAS
ncbi:unnamed protein product [Pedinophyceae sp. YPF-701]|nr:unnamed protein product [Pedinophyceae sp. YPF-701]